MHLRVIQDEQDLFWELHKAIVFSDAPTLEKAVETLPTRYKLHLTEIKLDFERSQIESSLKRIAALKAECKVLGG